MMRVVVSLSLRTQLPRRVALAVCVACSLCSEAYADAPALAEVRVDAPFEMPAIRVPDFSGCPRFSITDLGAKQNDKASASDAISSAISAAHNAGGGVVVIPEGNWLSGKVHLKSNVNLHLDPGATLCFSEDPSDYLPAVPTTWEGMECYNYSPLIYAYNCRNIAVTGGGTLRADLAVWKVWYARPQTHLDALKRLYEMASTGVPVDQRQMAVGEAHMRPQFIQFNRCENVLLEGVTIQNSPFWVIHPFLSRGVVIRGVRVNARGHNNDGVDPEMSQNVLIEDCDFNQGDDAISVKSGRNHDAWRLNTPSKNIVIRNCRVKNGHQLLAIGSELSGGIENVLVEDCQVDKSLTGVGHLLYIKTNERRGGYARNLYMRNVTAGDLRYGVLGIETDVLYQWRNLVPTLEVRLTPISGVFVQDVQVGRVKYLSKIEGQSEAPVENVSLVGVNASDIEGAAIENRNVEGFLLEDRPAGAISTARVPD
ncbi:MAG: glycoside hydrolase family 28 protein [Planctomycetales bacterium]|nr:glycoside hydrolase family 28 protein [Planctomycetales bacterium]